MNDPSRVEELFFAALEKGTPEERSAYLDDACPDEPGLRQRIELLLAAHPKAKGFLEPVAANAGAFDDSSPAKSGESRYPIDSTRDHVQAPSELIGSRIGPYKLLQRLGEGGMGTVYLAEQEQPVKRRVALKIIKSGMDSAQVVARFEQERQALAMMDHPNIAKVLDAGATEAGRPFFVMELVKGISITRFCDQEHLTPQERLELFVPVCQAVQHAHQKGIIHRDLKPSNVLIALYDGKAVPKVIDFGVAKATHQKLTERTMFTEVGSIVGTLEYMAPEQAELNNLDIDTRADIYSLGVLMYELLAGSPPFTAKQLRGAAFTEMLRMIREVEPPKPSTRLSSSDELPSIAANRKLEPRRLTSLVTGELDWIVMKALEKDRGRRYETANGLAMDIGRYLADEPVLASPPSAVYRMKKFVRRNKGPVAAAAGLLLALSAGVLGTSIGLVQAENARHIAQTKEQEALAEKAKALEAAEQERLAKEEVQSQKAEVEAARDREAKERGYAVAIANFVKDDFLALTSVEGQTRFDGEQLTKDATLRDLLDRAAEKLKERKDLAPRTEAELCWIIGVSYRGVGEFAKAIPYLERSVELYRQQPGPDEDATLNSQNSLAVAYRAAGQIDKALPLIKATLQASEAKLGTDHPQTLGMRDNLASAYWAARQLDKALPLFEVTLQGREAKLGPDHPDTLTTRNNLALAYKDAGQLDKALPLFEATLQACEAKLGADHPHTLDSRNNLANAYQAVGRLDKALPLFEATLEASEARLGADHPDTLASRNNLAVAYQVAGQFDKALPLYEATLEASEAKLGADHTNTLTSRNNLASAYQAAGQLDKALPLFEATLRAQEAKLGPDHPDTLVSRNNLALAYSAAGQLDKALPLYEATLKASEAKLGADHPQTLGSRNNLANAYRAAEQLDKALPLFEETFKAQEAKLGADHPDTLTTRNNLALAYSAAGQLDKALPLFEATLKAQEAKLGADHPGTLLYRNNLAYAYQSAGQLDKALPMFESTLKTQEAKLGADHPDTLLSRNNLAIAYKSAGQLDKALPFFEQAATGIETSRFQHEYAGRILGNTIVAYAQAGQFDKAEGWHRKWLAHVREKAGATSPAFAGELAALGSNLLRRKRWSDAEPILRECLAIREQQQPDVWTTFNTQSMLGEALFGQQKYAEAEPLLLAGYEGLKEHESTIPPQAKIRLAEALQRLVDFYTVTGQAEKAEDWQKKLDAGKPKEPGNGP